MEVSAVHYIKFNKRQVMPMFRHCARKNEHYSNENIDPSRTHLNYNLAPGGNQWGRMQDRLKQLTYREQKNNIVLCGWVVTAPANLPEEKQRQFFKIMYDFMCKKYDEKNVVSAYVHKDEAGPGHMHFLFVPATPDNKLSASKTTNRILMQNIHEEAQQEIDKYFNHQYLLRADNPEDRAKDSVPVETMKKALASLQSQLQEAELKLEETKINIDFAKEKISNQEILINSQNRMIRNKINTIQDKDKLIADQEKEIQTQKDKKEMWADIANEYKKDAAQYKALAFQQQTKINEQAAQLQALKNQAEALQEDIQNEQTNFNRYKAKNLKRINSIIKQIDEIQTNTNDIQAIVELQLLKSDAEEIFDEQAQMDFRYEEEPEL